MAGAVQAFSEAFSSYRASVVDYAAYSVVMAIASMAISFFTALCLGIFGIVSLGSVADVAASGGNISVSAIGVAVSLLALFVGLLAVLWVSSGLNGAYFATMNGFISKRKQTLGGFFLMVPKYATGIFIISIVCCVLVLAPFALALAAAQVLGGIPSLLLSALGALYAVAASFLLVFAVPAVVVDGKGPMGAIKLSVVSCSRNALQLLIYVVVACALALPALVPLFGLLYAPLFYMPLVASALLRLYRTAQ